MRQLSSQEVETVSGAGLLGSSDIGVPYPELGGAVGGVINGLGQILAGVGSIVKGVISIFEQLFNLR